jgi:tetratricopeptide (TPR) repeat protein
MDGSTLWPALVLVCTAATFALLILKRQGRISLPGGFGGDRKRESSCPNLGLANDPFACFEGPDDEHRCYAHMHHDRIDLAHQQRFCLTSNYHRCPFLMVKPASAEQPLWERLSGVATLQAERAWTAAPQVAATTAERVCEWAAAEWPAVRRILAWGPAGVRGGAAAGAVLVIRVVAAAAAVAVAAIMWSWRHRAEAGQALFAGYRIAGRAASADRALRGLGWGRPGRPQPRPAFRRVNVRLADIAHTRPVLIEQPVEVTAVADAPAPSLCDESVHRADSGPQREALGPSLLARSAAREADLLERGIAAFEAGHEAEAHELFKQAAERNPRAERAWFWRAKTAQTLDEVIQCLERALELDSSNHKIKANLAWARQRRDRDKLIASAAQPGSRPTSSQAQRPTPGVQGPPTSVKGPWPGPLGPVFAALLGLARAAGTAAAIVLGAAWIAGGLPAELRRTLEAANTAGAFDLLPIVDWSVLTDRTRLELVSNYNVLSAIPFVLGFLALLVGAGLLNREGWTRFWGPALALSSAWLWVGVFGVEPKQVAVALCSLVALGGLVVRPSEVA